MSSQVQAAFFPKEVLGVPSNGNIGIEQSRLELMVRLFRILFLVDS
jgi:hypothetical protein